MPLKTKISDSNSGYAKREKGRARTQKLILNQNIKYENMVHYRILKFYVKIGVKVKKYIEYSFFNKILYVEIILKTIHIKEHQLKLN